MTKVDIFSGFLGAGKTTLIKKLIAESYKGEKLVFKPLETQINDIVFDETNIINKPQKNKKQEIKSLTVKQHNYSKGKEEVTLYSWYISGIENSLITFNTRNQTRNRKC